MKWSKMSIHGFRLIHTVGGVQVWAFLLQVKWSLIFQMTMASSTWCQTISSLLIKCWITNLVKKIHQAIDACPPLSSTELRFKSSRRLLLVCLISFKHFPLQQKSFLFIAKQLHSLSPFLYLMNYELHIKITSAIIFTLPLM